MRDDRHDLVEPVSTMSTKLLFLLVSGCDADTLCSTILRSEMSCSTGSWLTRASSALSLVSDCSVSMKEASVLWTASIRARVRDQLRYPSSLTEMP